MFIYFLICSITTHIKKIKITGKKEKFSTCLPAIKKESKAELSGTHNHEMVTTDKKNFSNLPHKRASNHKLDFLLANRQLSLCSGSNTYYKNILEFSLLSETYAPKLIRDEFYGSAPVVCGGE